MELVELSGRITGRLGYDYRLRHRRDGKAGTTNIHTGFLTAMLQFSHGDSIRTFSFLRSDIQFSVGPTVRTYTTNVPTLEMFFELKFWNFRGAQAPV